MNRGRIRQNIAHLIARDQSTESHEYEWESLSDASCELGVDVIHAYTTQPSIVEWSSIGADEFDSQHVSMDHASPSRSIPELDSFPTFSIGMNS